MLKVALAATLALSLAGCIRVTHANLQVSGAPAEVEAFLAQIGDEGRDLRVDTKVSDGKETVTFEGGSRQLVELSKRAMNGRLNIRYEGTSWRFPA